MSMTSPPSSPKPSELDEVASSVLASYDAGPRSMQHTNAYELPQRAEIEKCVETVRALLLPGFVGSPLVSASHDDVRVHVLDRLHDLQARLRKQVYRGLHHRCRLPGGGPKLECSHCADAATGITSRFLAALPELRRALGTDVEAAYEGDPAATGTDEVIFCYPGLYAITCYRMGHRLLAEGASIIPRMIT